jgi:HEPN domain-containing protein
MTGIVPNGILANEFWIDAKAYLQAAEILINSGSGNVNPPTYFTLGHALELALKAYLLAKDKDINPDDLLDIGHDLAEAHKRASKCGLQVKGEYTVALIERLSDFHIKYIFRYPYLTRDERRLVLRGHLVRAEEIFDVVASICAQIHATVIFARIDAANAGEFLIETWHMGFPEDDEITAALKQADQ